MINKRLVKTACGLCAGSCGVLVTLEDNRVIKIEGDPESPPNMGTLCRIGRSCMEYLYHPDRLQYPLKRMGQRGDGNWQQISWDEAFYLVAEALNKVKREHGPEGVVMVHGSAKGYMDTHLVRLANAFGTPNVVCADHVCHVPRMLAAEITFGFFPSTDTTQLPACILIWGFNPAETRAIAYKGLIRAVSEGIKMMVIDPIKIEIAEKADLWLQIKPGSDLALALGMMHVIINEELYDKNFVDKWTVGFDKLKAHVQDYTPARMAEITWIPADLIIKAAKFYAGNKPGHIEWGNALDHNSTSFQTGRAVAILMALTGNLGVPGGEIEEIDSGFLYGKESLSADRLLERWSAQLELRDNITIEERQKKVGVDLGMIPDFRYVLPQSVIKSILEGEPYHISAAYVQASNPCSSWPNIRKTCQAFKQLDFLAVSDMFMTPTAALADVVFPVASFLEYDGIAKPPMGKLARVQRKVAKIGECRSDHEIINGLAKKLGLGEYFWDTIDNFWDTVLKPTGITFVEFKNLDWFAGHNPQLAQYRKYEQHGFRTPSGKVEFYSNRLEDWGLDPMPTYHESPKQQYSARGKANEYTLLCTTHKSAAYRHSGGRQIRSLRNSHPDPVTIIHPETASKLGIEDGDWINIETNQGRIKQKAHLSLAVNESVVVLDHAWWFPEKGQTGLFGWLDSNYNALTSSDPPFNPEMGSFNIRGLVCRIYKS